MTTGQTFQWHPKARLFCAGQELKRHTPKPQARHRAIAAEPAQTAMADLAGAILAGQSFCIHSGHALSATAVPLGHFATQTGGSTGTPKTILRTQASWTASFAQNADTFRYTPQDAIAVLGQLSHSLALYGLLEALHMGMDAHLLAGMNATRQNAQIAQAGVSILYLTPTQLRLLAHAPKGSPLPHVRLILCGGGALDAQTRALGAALCPNAQILVFYGAAETSFITLSDAQTPGGSVGKAYPGVQLAIRDATGSATQHIGEVWVKSPYLFEGYASGDNTQTNWHQGYVSIGELGQLDPDGNLWLKGRKSRMVTVADKNVFPEEVEAMIQSIEGGRQTAVVAIPDPMRGHRLVAILDGPSDMACADRIRRGCLATFGPLLSPKVILFHPQFPLLASGKPDIQTLTDWAERQI